MLQQVASLEDKIPVSLKGTLMLRGLGLWKIPLLFMTSPKVVELSDKRAVIKIPLNRMTKNHLGSMYFGALAIGADAVVGMLAVYWIRKARAKKVHLSFKDFKADFLRRPDHTVLFVCDQGAEIQALVEKVAASHERINQTIAAHAILPKTGERVANFALTLSLKRK